MKTTAPTSGTTVPWTGCGSRTSCRPAMRARQGLPAPRGRCALTPSPGIRRGRAAKHQPGHHPPLDMAAATRGGFTAGVVFHADRGTQFTSQKLATYMRATQATVSMGRAGVCWDNAVAESLWAPSQPITTTGAPSPPATRSTPGSPPGSKTSTTAAESTPASAANPPSNTNDTKRPRQQPHKQTANNLHTDPACSPLDKQDRRPSTEYSCNHRHHCRPGTEHSCNRWHHCRPTTPDFSYFSLNRGVTGFKDRTQPTNRGVIGFRSRLQTATMARSVHPCQSWRQIPHRIRTTPSGLDNSRINKPSTTCAQGHDNSPCVG